MQRGYRGALQFPLVAAVVLAVCPHAASAAAAAGIDWAAESYCQLGRLPRRLWEVVLRAGGGDRPEGDLRGRARGGAAAQRRRDQDVEESDQSILRSHRGGVQRLSRLGQPPCIANGRGACAAGVRYPRHPQRLSPVRPPKIGGLEGQGRGDQDQEPRHVRFMLGVLVDGEYRVPRGTGDEHHA